ncbi:MAG: transposase [Sedimentisphaerales bacterium]|nr:transposase [Sedimentisphaerales bacterium]
MAKSLLPEELWKIIEPHIPVKSRRKTHAGCHPLGARECLTGILFVLASGIPWEMLPRVKHPFLHETLASLSSIGYTEGNV